MNLPELIALLTLVIQVTIFYYDKEKFTAFKSDVSQGTLKLGPVLQSKEIKVTMITIVLTMVLLNSLYETQ